MNFRKITIENFGTVKQLSLNLENRGLVLITGKNNDTPKADSNGAGKSLLLEAFCWCLWGRTVRDDDADAVVNETIGKNCKVTVEFSEGKQNYKVTRYRKNENAKKPNDVELHLNSVDLSSSSMKMTQGVINGVVGLTFDTFCALMPGSGKNAAQMTDSDIKALLENMLQITALARARVEADKRIKSLKPKIAKLEQEILALDTQLEKDHARLDEYKQSEQAHAQTIQEKITALLADKKEAEAAVQRSVSVLGVGEEASLEIGRISELRKAACELFKHCEASIDTAKQASQVREHKFLARKAEASGELKVRRESHRKACALKDNCDVCAQQIPISHAKELQVSAMEEIQRIESDVQALESHIQHNQRSLAEQLAPHQAAAKTHLAEIETHNASIRNLSPAVEESKVATRTLPGLRKAVRAIEVQEKALAETKSPYAGWIADTNLGIARAKKGRATKLADLETKQLREVHLQFWKDAFAPNGIRSYILDNVTPVLNDRAKHYCDVLTDGEMEVDFSTKTTLKSGQTREKFSINIKQKHGGSSYKSNSKGERQRANLVVSFALSDLAEMHSSKSVDFRFLDEPFEGVDESGTDAVVALLKEQQSRYPTVFVVTHQTHFKEVFPTEITMVKSGGFSHLEE